MATPQEEAAQLLDQVVKDLAGTTPDLKVALRRCQHACTLVAWQDAADWFKRELSGYPEGIDVPSHRIGKGFYRWRIQGGAYHAAQTMVSRAISRDTEEEVQEAEEVFRIGIDGLRAGANSGYSEGTGQTKRSYNDLNRRNYTLEWTRTIPKAAYEVILLRVEQYTFDFASNSYRVLRYGNFLTDIWAGYRTQVDDALRKLNLTNHLDAVQKGLQSDNPQEWRNAVFGCRSMLEDVAAFLWRDSRKFYDHLPDGSGKGKMQVTADRFTNRLHAYVHQKGLHRKPRKFLKSEIERLVDSIRSLKDLEATAHEPIALEDARTAALATYFVIGELAMRTDLQPVETYGQPAATEDEAQ